MPLVFIAIKLIMMNRLTFIFFHHGRRCRYKGSFINVLKYLVYVNNCKLTCPTIRIASSFVDNFTCLTF
jgi:hypothetical protein